MRKFVALFAVVLVVSLATAQAPQGPPKPGPEHKKLEYWVGKWNGQADSKASPFGPAGKGTSVETCRWLPGGFFVICERTGNGPMGEVKGTGIMGYDANEKKYTYYAADRAGGAFMAKGTVSGNVWTWTTSMNMAGKSYRLKYTATATPPNGQSFKFEYAEGNGPMQMVGEGKATRGK